MLDVTLEVPLGLLDIGRLLQYDNADATGFRCSVKRMEPPLPAASRPSKMMRIF